MTQPTTNSIAEINKTKLLVIKWPDETCIFVNEAYNDLSGILTIKFRLKDEKPGRQPYENTYKLDAFDTTIGTVNKVVFQQVNAIKNVKSIS